MAETVLEELQRYVNFDAKDEAALRALHPVAQPFFVPISTRFYARIFEHEDARKALEGGESMVGRLKVKLVAWMERLLSGPWDNDYYEARCLIGRVHVRIALPQHYMFGAMNLVRDELNSVADRHYIDQPEARESARLALGKILDIELAIMLHTYREDLLAQQSRTERLATFGQLVGSIGHELRNPLGVMESSLFILKGRIKDDERATKHVDRIGEQLGRANRIITELLDMIRDKPLARERQQLAPIIASVLQTVPHSPDITFRVVGLEELADVGGDAVQLRQVFQNLVENAVHAASPRGEVRISGDCTDERVDVSVEDSGPGIDPSIRKRLFEPLVTTKTKGIGLGLALVKRIVERHGGTITVSHQPGRGARFVVTLPKA